VSDRRSDIKYSQITDRQIRRRAIVIWCWRSFHSRRYAE